MYKMADEDKNGLLSWEEVFELCKNCLKKFIGDKDKKFLKTMAEFFSRFIFNSLEVSVDDEIPFETVKNYILEVSLWSNLNFF